MLLFLFILYSILTDLSILFTILFLADLLFLFASLFPADLLLLFASLDSTDPQFLLCDGSPEDTSEADLSF